MVNRFPGALALKERIMNMKKMKETPEKIEPVEIEIIDDFPGMIVDPKELPEQEIPEDFDI